VDETLDNFHQTIQRKGLHPTLIITQYTKKMYYFYVLENAIGELYFGYSSNLTRRLREHQEGKSTSTKG
jgi:hypothetical protein